MPRNISCLEDHTVLDFSGSEPSRLCNGISRRRFLSAGTLGVAGLTLGDVFRLKAHGAVRAEATHKAIIMVFLNGGPSHIDMYDPKPDAPAEIRGWFKAIPTNVPGIRFSELMPLQAKIADKLAIVRGLENNTTHEFDSLFRGERGPNAKRPVFGSVVSRLLKGDGSSLPRKGTGMPPYVAIVPENSRLGASCDPGDSSYLGAGYRPFVPTGPARDNLRLCPEISLERLADRKALLHSLDTLRRDLDASGDLTGMDAFNAQALDLITSRTDAFDISREPDKLRARYGKGIEYLQARRLVEAGVSVVTLNAPGDWDGHEERLQKLHTNVPALDQGLHALITDLHERGLDNDVVVCAWGEMGRSPKFDKKGGRDHWPYGFAVLAGGGLRMGQVIGDTGAWGERPKDSPYTPKNVLATLYHVLGIDPARATVTDASGRARDLLDDPRTIAEMV
jgi:hypothetical protein